MSDTPSNKRIDEAHSRFPKSAAEQVADHGDELGFKHRSYYQGDEDCYICTLLRQVSSMKAALTMPTMAEITLACGVLTASERRSVKAALEWFIRKAMAERHSVGQE